MSGISELLNQFTINGVLSTDDTVFSNMERLAASCGCWITYDIHAGLWSVIINRAGNSVASFNDSNIIGTIDLQGTGLTELYNSVRVTYPRYDINDELDWVQVDLPQADRNANEPDQALEMELSMTNDPVQAELIGFLELKQNRVDKVISFVTDYTAIDLNAGDIIDITNSALGFTNKAFRIMSMRELDADDGSIRIEISALEYDASVYDNDLNRYERSNSNGITTIGAIGVPGTPQITRFQQDSRPRILIETTVPTGLVNGMEFWLSQTSNTAGFDLIGLQRPQTSTTFATGATVTYDFDSLNVGNVWVKVRGTNATVDGPFSNVAADTFTPTQVTDAIGPNTVGLDSLGNILPWLAITELIGYLDDLMRLGQSTGIFDKIFDIFEDVTGIDLLGDIGNIANGAAQGANAFTTVVANGTSLLADQSLDTLTISAGNNISITAVAGTDTMTISSPGLWQGSQKFVQSATPTTGVVDGDIWFKI